MRGHSGSQLAPLQLGLFTPVLLALGLGCMQEPTNDALTWNGRGMPLPAETGAGGARGAAGDGTGTGGTGPATGGAGTGPDTGAAGSDPSTGAAGSGSGPGAAGSGPGTGAAGSGPTTGMGGRAGAPASNAGTSGGAGTRDAGAPPPPPNMDPVGATCHLDVSVTTKDTGRGSYAPRNVGAIWIETSAGKFIKSLNVWAAKRIDHLGRWNSSTTAAGLSRNRVDAVTAATMSGHGTRTGSWNCTDTNKQLVSNGAYQVCFDLNDTNSSSKSDCVPITIGKTATTVMPADALPSFTARSLRFTP
jgi:hypothetical protein